MSRGRGQPWLPHSALPVSECHPASSPPLSPRQKLDWTLWELRFVEHLPVTRHCTCDQDGEHWLSALCAPGAKHSPLLLLSPTAHETEMGDVGCYTSP